MAPKFPKAPWFWWKGEIPRSVPVPDEPALTTLIGKSELKGQWPPKRLGIPAEGEATDTVGTLLQRVATELRPQQIANERRAVSRDILESRERLRAEAELEDALARFLPNVDVRSAAQDAEEMTRYRFEIDDARKAMSQAMREAAELPRSKLAVAAGAAGAGALAAPDEAEAGLSTGLIRRVLTPRGMVPGTEVHRLLEGAAMVERPGVLSSVHVTDDPQRVEEVLRSGRPLFTGRDPGKVGDLGPGLYTSERPDVWAGRSKNKWAFLDRLSPEEFQRLSKNVVDDIASYSTEAGDQAADIAEAALKDRRQLRRLAEGRYGVPFWEPEYLRGVDLGIDPGPLEVPVKTVGDYAVLNRHPRGEDIDELMARFSGAILPQTDASTQGWPPTRPTWYHPMTVTYFNDAVRKFGSWRNPLLAVGAGAMAGAAPTRAEAADDPRLRTGAALREAAGRAWKEVRPAAETVGETALDVLRMAAPMAAVPFAASSGLGALVSGRNPLTGAAAGLAQAFVEPVNVLTGQELEVPGFTYLGREIIPEKAREEHPLAALAADLALEIPLGTAAMRAGRAAPAILREAALAGPHPMRAGRAGVVPTWKKAKRERALWNRTMWPKGPTWRALPEGGRHPFYEEPLPARKKADAVLADYAERFRAKEFSGEPPILRRLLHKWAGRDYPVPESIQSPMGSPEWAASELAAWYARKARPAREVAEAKIPKERAIARDPRPPPETPWRRPPEPLTSAQTRRWLEPWEQLPPSTISHAALTTADLAIPERTYPMRPERAAFWKKVFPEQFSDTEVPSAYTEAAEKAMDAEKRLPYFRRKEEEVAEYIKELRELAYLSRDQVNDLAANQQRLRVIVREIVDLEAARVAPSELEWTRKFTHTEPVVGYYAPERAPRKPVFEAPDVAQVYREVAGDISPGLEKALTELPVPLRPERPGAAREFLGSLKRLVRDLPVVERPRSPGEPVWLRGHVAATSPLGEAETMENVIPRWLGQYSEARRAYERGLHQYHEQTPMGILRAALRDKTRAIQQGKTLSDHPLNRFLSEEALVPKGVSEDALRLIADAREQFAHDRALARVFGSPPSGIEGTLQGEVARDFENAARVIEKWTGKADQVYWTKDELLPLAARHPELAKKLGIPWRRPGAGDRALTEEELLGVYDRNRDFSPEQVAIRGRFLSMEDLFPSADLVPEGVDPTRPLSDLETARLVALAKDRPVLGAFPVEKDRALLEKAAQTWDVPPSGLEHWAEENLGDWRGYYRGVARRERVRDTLRDFGIDVDRELSPTVFQTRGGERRAVVHAINKRLLEAGVPPLPPEIGPGNVWGLASNVSWHKRTLANVTDDALRKVAGAAGRWARVDPASVPWISRSRIEDAIALRVAAVQELRARAALRPDRPLYEPAAWSATKEAFENVLAPIPDSAQPLAFPSKLDPLVLPTPMGRAEERRALGRAIEASRTPVAEMPAPDWVQRLPFNPPMSLPQPGPTIFQRLGLAKERLAPDLAEQIETIAIFPTGGMPLPEATTRWHNILSGYGAHFRNILREVAENVFGIDPAQTRMFGPRGGTNPAVRAAVRKAGRGAR